MFICPACKASLHEVSGKDLACSCGQTYPRLETGGIDFLQGRGFPDFQLDPEDVNQQTLLEKEEAGVAWRMETFLIPLIRRFGRHAGKTAPLSVLDCGCGNGLSVDILNAHGFCAVGIDAGSARHRQWDSRSYAHRLHSADALRIPFAAGTFSVALSSGLVEHIGIHEEEKNGYHSRRLPSCHDQRQRFISELVRVVEEDGFILLDHPHGAAPVDFWHGGRGGGIRWHFPIGDMLPRFGEIARYFKVADPAVRLYSLSPRSRLRFHQVANHWYGEAFAPLMKAWLRSMEFAPLRFLARTGLNPYLVTLATRRRHLPWLRS